MFHIKSVLPGNEIQVSMHSYFVSIYSSRLQTTNGHSCGGHAIESCCSGTSIQLFTLVPGSLLHTLLDSCFVVGLSARKLSPWPFCIHNHILWIISPFVLVESPPWLFNPYPPGAVWKFGDVASKKKFILIPFFVEGNGSTRSLFLSILIQEKKPHRDCARL